MQKTRLSWSLSVLESFLSLPVGLFVAVLVTDI